MPNSLELKFSAQTADASAGVQQLADLVVQLVRGIGELSQTIKSAAEGFSGLAAGAQQTVEATVAVAAAVQEAAAAEQTEISELARLTEMLGSEEMARASLAAQIIDSNAVAIASEEDVAASLQRREAIMAEVTARQSERLASQSEVTAATTAGATQEVAAAVAVHEAQQVGISDATQTVILQTAAAEAAKTLAVQIEDLAQAQRNLSEIEAGEPGNLAAISRAQQELAAEAQRVADAEKVAAAAKLASAEASDKLAASEKRAAESARSGTFAGKAQDVGQLLTTLGLVDPQLLRVGVGVQLLGQAAESLGPKIAEAGGGLAGFAAVLGPIALIGAGVTVVLTGLAAAAEFVGSALKAGIGEQESETTFAVLLGNVEKAKARLEELDETALKFHLDPEQVRAASADLTRFSQGALGAGDSLNLVIEAAARSGHSITAIGTLVGRLYETLESGAPIGRMGTQLVHLGVISQSDLNHLGNLQKEGAKGPQIWQAAQDALNKYSGAAEARANTFEGSIHGISTAWTEIEEAFGRPLADALTPVLTGISQLLISLVPTAKAAGKEIGDAVKTIYGLVKDGDLAERFENSLDIAVDKAALHFIDSFKDAWTQIKNFFAQTPLDMAKAVGNALVTPEERKGLSNAASSVVDFLGNSSMGGAEAGVVNDSLPDQDAGAPTPPETPKSPEQTFQEGLIAKIQAKEKRDAVLDARAHQTGSAATTPNADAQFTTPDPGDVVTPNPKAVKARTQAVDEGSEAEKRYKEYLDVTNNALAAGDLSQAQADAQNIQTTKDYIANLERLQAKLPATSDKYGEMTVRINAARAALLTLAEGAAEYQHALESTKAALDAGTISQTQAYAQDNKTISDYIARLRALQATVAPTSEKFQELATKINQAQAALRKTTPLGQITAQFHQVINAWGDLGKNASEWLSTTMTSGISTVSQGLTGLITHTGNWKQTFLSAVDSMLEGLIELGVKMVLHYALAAAGMESNAAVGESTTASTVATQVAAGTAIATAHAPAAAATSISSYGVAGIVGAALAIAAIGAIIALLAGGFEEGGLIPGAPSHSDNRLAHVATGEYVVRTKAVQHYGPAIFDALNALAVPSALPAYAAGGLVGTSSGIPGWVHALANIQPAGFTLPAYAAGGLVTGGAYSGSGNNSGGSVVNKISVQPPSVNVSLVQPNTRAAMLEALKSAEGHAHILDAVVKGKHKLPFKQ